MGAGLVRTKGGTCRGAMGVKEQAKMKVNWGGGGGGGNGGDQG